MAFPAKTATKKSPVAAKTATKPAAKTTTKPASAKPAAKRVAAPAKTRTASATALTAEQKKEMLKHTAPSDMKTFSMELTVRTMKDGFFHPQVKAERVKGRWDNPDAKRYDMLTYDSATIAALVARLQAVCHATNPLRRLTPNTAFGLVLRVAANAEGNVRVGVQGVKRTVSKDGKKKWVWFDKTSDKDKVNTDYKKLKRATRHLTGAFVDCQLPPTGRQAKPTDE